MFKTLKGAALGFASACVYNGLHLVKDLTAPVSYPLVGFVGGVAIGMETKQNTTDAGFFGLVVGTAMIPFAPVFVVSNVAMWPVSCTIGTVIGALAANGK